MDSSQMYSLHVFLVSCAVLAVVAAGYDLRTHRIPNWLNALGFAGGVVGHAAMAYRAGGGDFALHAAGYSVLGAAVVGAVPFLLWRVDAFGGGDLKIVLAIGALCHASLGMTVLFVALAIVASYAVLKLAWTGQYRARLLEPIRFGPALAISAIGVVLLHGGG